MILKALGTLPAVYLQHAECFDGFESAHDIPLQHVLLGSRPRCLLTCSCVGQPALTSSTSAAGRGSAAFSPPAHDLAHSLVDCDHLGIQFLPDGSIPAATSELPWSH